MLQVEQVVVVAGAYDTTGVDATAGTVNTGGGGGGGGASGSESKC